MQMIATGGLDAAEVRNAKVAPNMGKLRLMVLVVFSLNAWAQQNSDVSIMGGLFQSAKTTVSGTTIQVTSPSGPSGEVNFGYQILRRSRLELWIETPLVFGFYSLSTSVTNGTTSSSGSTSFAFTPGVRVRIPTQSRLSVYGVGGFGLGTFAHFQSVVDGTSAHSEAIFSSRPAFDLGGGADIRLTRLLSLRAEVRDIIPAGALSSGMARNRVFYEFGFAFHF
jgi:hypothetical protein